MSEFDSPYTYLTPPPRMFEAALEFVYRKYCGHVWAKLEEELEIYTRDRDERKEVIEVCKQYADKPRAYKTFSRTTIAYDFEDWGYAEQFDMDGLQDTFYFDGDEVGLQLHFARHKTRAGCWKQYDNVVQVDVMGTLPQRVEYLRFSLRRLNKILRHEMGHMAQSYFSCLTPDRRHASRFGFLSRDKRSKAYDLRGYKLGVSSGRRQSHACRDIEFFPRLDDEIHMWMHYMSDLPKSLRHKAVRMACDQGTYQMSLFDKPYKERTERENDQHHVVDKGIRFFYVLKEHEPDKYREACRRFVKALVEVGWLA